MAIKRRSKIRAQYAMSSLTDIVFLLLIFFMLTSTFVAPHALDLDLPTADSPAEEHPPVRIYITDDRQYYLNATQVPFDRLKAELNRELDQYEDKVVVVNSDKDVSIGSVTAVLVIIQDLEARALLATEPD